MSGGKIALVTGSGSGVGRSAALALLGASYNVVLAGRRKDALEETIGLAGAHAANALAVPTDVSQPESVAALFATIKQKFGRLDVLFNNAGGNIPSTNFGDVTWEGWSGVVAVNLNGAFLCANAAFRMMRDQTPQGGRIINNGSISAHTPRPGSVAYTATKHAITGLTKTISLDGRPFGIACGQIDIGNAATDMTRQMSHSMPQANGMGAAGPPFAARPVAAAVLYMASLPLDANVQFLTITATTMPFIGRG